MSKNLGHLVLQSYDLQDNFFHTDVFNDEDQIINNAYDKNSLGDPDFIVGYETGMEKAINNSFPSHIPFEVEIDSDTGIIIGKFKDSGIATTKYQIKVILFTEEFPISIASDD